MIQNALRSLFPGLLVAFGLLASPLAHAQDSFVRESDILTGRPLLSVLGSGLGRQPAALVLEFACPVAEVLNVELRGADFPAGAPITFDLGDPERGWQEVRLLTVHRPDPDRLTIGVDAASFRRALAEVASPAAGEASAAVLQVGSELGVAVGLDGLAREMGRLAQDCAARRSAQLREPARYTR